METFILVALAVPLVTAVAMFGRRGVTEAWHEVAKSVGLTVRTSGPRGQASLEGTVGSAQVTVDTVDHFRDRKKVPWTRIRASGDIPPGLMVGGEGFWRRWNEEQGEDSVEMAGVAFDDHVIVRGAIPEIFGLLNGDTRAQFRELEKRYRAFVLNGVVHVERQGAVKEASELAKLVRRVASVAMALSVQGPSLADRLGANVVTDANALVRQRNLEVLLERYPETASAQLACEHAMGDRSYGVSVLAARHSGADGIATLERVLSDVKAPTEYRLKSLEHLVETLLPDQADMLLARTVDHYPELRPTAIVMLTARGLDPGADVLLELLRPGHPEGWIAFAKAIAALDRQDLTAPLEALLDEQSGVDVLEFGRDTLQPAGIPPEEEQEDGGAEDSVGVTTNGASGLAESIPVDSASGELDALVPVVVEITGELRIDLDVQQAAKTALTSLLGWGEEAGLHEELEPQLYEDEEAEREASMQMDDLEALGDTEVVEDPVFEGTSGQEDVSGRDHPGGEEEGAPMPHTIPVHELVAGPDAASEMELEANAE